MIKLTRGVLILFCFNLIFIAQESDAQYLNFNPQKTPLSFMASQYWNNFNSTSEIIEETSVSFVPRILHKSGLSILFGGGGAFIGTALGAGLFEGWGAFVFGAPTGFLLMSSVGAKIGANVYKNEAPYGLIVFGGMLGSAAGVGMGLLFRESFDTNGKAIPVLIGAVIFCVAGEVWITERDFSDGFEEGEDEYIYSGTDKLVFHEYYKSTQVVNIDLIRIQL